MGIRQRTAQVAVLAIGVAAIIATGLGQGDLFELIIHDLPLIYCLLTARQQRRLPPDH